MIEAVVESIGHLLGERQPFSVKSASLHEDALIVSPGLCSLTRKPSASTDTTATRIACNSRLLTQHKSPEEDTAKI